MTTVPDCTKGASPFRIRIPFLTTSPLADLVLLLLGLPLWWALGLEQVIWAPVLGWSILKISLRGQPLRIPTPAIWLAAFIVVQVASAFFIREELRFLSSLRTLYAYVSGLLAIVVAATVIRGRRDLRHVVCAAAGAILVACAMALGAAVDLWRPSFEAPLGALLPPSLRESEFGTRFVHRTLGSTGWFQPIGTYYRLSGPFLFATMFAAVLALSTPLFLMARRLSRGAERALWGTAVVPVLATLVLTTGRGAMLALTVATLWYVLAERQQPLLARAVLLTSLGAVAVLVGMLFAPELSNGLWALFEARGSSSSDRLVIYRATLAEAMDRPILGWGTERDMENFPYPMGSHSWYLGVLFKHGVVGLLVLLGFIVSSWQAAGSNAVGSMARWSLLVLILNGVTDVPDLDVSVLVFACLIVAIGARSGAAMSRP